MSINVLSCCTTLGVFLARVDLKLSKAKISSVSMSIMFNVETFNNKTCVLSLNGVVPVGSVHSQVWSPADPIPLAHAKRKRVG